MANSQAARVTGVVLKQDRRAGAKVQPDGSTRNWSMQGVRVLVGGEDVCDVSYPEDVPLPGRGEAVDLLVGVRSSGSFLNIDYSAEWTQRHTDASV